MQFPPLPNWSRSTLGGAFFMIKTVAVSVLASVIAGLVVHHLTRPKPETRKNGMMA